jgi:hypothetical protein
MIFLDVQQLRIIESIELGHIIDELAEAGSGQMVLPCHDCEGKAVAAVVVLRGENTQRYLDTLAQVSRDLACS